jgi:hypothetical protein
MDSQHLLVPIRVQALVIDDAVIERAGVLQKDGGKHSANDGRWSPEVHDYAKLTGTMNRPGPLPFYGATREFDGHPTELLVYHDLPGNKDRGVYLHWVLPAGLRRAYTPGKLDFPALPDHWLIVRFSHLDSEVKTKAWFVDGGAVAGEDHANLLFAQNDKYVARRVGKVVPLAEFATANVPGERTTITALGNEHTGSPTFTGFISENRNVFSWQDKLEDLRQPNAAGKIPKGTTLTYAVLGWYRDPNNEPLKAPAARLVEQRDKENKLRGWLIDPPGWFIETNPGDMVNRRSVFHGIVAHINYWSETTYKGKILGYPGAPSVGSVLGKPEPPFKVGVGNNAEDALVSLVSGSYVGEERGTILADDHPNLWKALEAVIYRQTESLVKNWRATSRDMTVHQNWFATRDAGKIWFIRPKADSEPVFSKDPKKATPVEPTPEQLAKLDELNQAQSKADAVSRELAALQQDLYARWWRLAEKSHDLRLDTRFAADCRTVAERVRPLQPRLTDLLNSVGTLAGELTSKLPADKLELKYDAAPRFWTPADPVVVVRNCGQPTKHRFPRQLQCRFPEQIVTTGQVKVEQQRETFSTPVGVAEIATAARTHLPACPEVLTGLLNEASIVEQTIRYLAQKTLPETQDFRDAGLWHQWTERLDNDLTRDSTPRDEVNFGRGNVFDIRGDRLVEFWGEQPWSPLFLDWQITWFPTPEPSTAKHPFGPVWKFDQSDFSPVSRQSVPQAGYTVRGRSLLTPIDERIFKEPIDTLKKLIGTREGATTDETSAFPPMVREILKRYEIVWGKTLSELASAGLMGQALTGFHQALLQRDATLPHVTPDPARPWITKAAARPVESEVAPLLKAPDQEGWNGEQLAPPAPAPHPSLPPAIPSSMIRAGALRIDELWLIDDFGQSADLFSLSTTHSRISDQVFHPRMRWFTHESVMAMPPRILQPVRLNFRFAATALTPDEKDCDPALRPICGWIFYNPLDHALVLCDRTGQLMGHLVMVKDQRGTRINWEASAGGVAINKIPNTSLKSFAESLVETTPSANPRLLQLLSMIDGALERIRPAAARRDNVLVGRPLALVNATIGLELFGKAWTDPNAPPSAVREGTGNATLDALRVRVNLGDSYSIEDGLVGYFNGGVYNRVVATQLPDQLPSSDYIKDSRLESLRVGFSAPEQLTLLMDPWGSVQAACGIVPAKTITLAHADLDQVVGNMEASFRVGPVLLEADRITLPTPAGEKGTWSFYGPLTNQTAAAVIPLDPRYFSDKPLVASEGRLLLLHEE